MGALFNTLGPTEMTVGEAGTETVAVLRNPRQAAFGSGMTIQGPLIHVDSLTVRTDADIDRISERLAFSAERAVWRAVQKL